MSQEPLDPTTWVRCNSCKKPIAYRAEYWVCNVSTCNRVRTGLKFCTVSCWDAHLPLVNHRESWAEERKAPTLEEWQKILSGEDKPKRTRKPKEDTPPEAPKTTAGPPKVLVRRGSGE
jgi:hypothetical protein